MRHYIGMTVADIIYLGYLVFFFFLITAVAVCAFVYSVVLLLPLLLRDFIR